MNKIYDVIIAGAGSSGAVAAISAARNGASVLLIDKNGYPGGMNTAGMVCPIMTFHAGDRQIIKGIPQEIIDVLIERGASLGHVPDPIGVVSSITPIEPEILKLVYFEMLAKLPNITVLFHTFICDTVVENGVVKSIQVVSKSGLASYQGKTFIDATGDGDVASFCKADFHMGRSSDGFSQPMTLMFQVGGVDIKKVIAYVKSNPEQFILNKDCDIDKYLAVSGFFDIVNTARINGDLTIPRDRVLFFQGMHPGTIVVNMTRITKLRGTNAKELTTAEFNSHNQISEIMLFFRKYLPGFANCHLLSAADTIGVRESRRICGDYTLTIDDVVNGVCFEDSIAMCAFPIDIHDPIGNDLNWVRKSRTCCYDIPYRVMMPKKLKNLLVTGRCISATHEAMASSRISATAMAIGQAAGLAAALESRDICDFRQTDVKVLQDKLIKQGAVVGKAWLD
ncbi:FAD-dependent oxidoreductase [Alkaliphilus peptidifermentans]|uniref:FAD dependent oxidoreductase n=1 Tax=Alkaliphilus peptidifermentans DSM 18978 TaxID=1120976 RepID=A0A1G5AAJ0_9FIRM|nr:FAD-dependent oxidoreductase [Alkaliphilus peptidifermentans]SCX74871.1 FAD dependent oxidoreductase [Alkaliphilus peptidifermentans DSM 18978]